MSIPVLRKAAAEMQVPFKQAAWCRVRYLRDMLKQNAADMSWFDAFTVSGRPWDDEAVTISNRILTLAELIQAARELRTLAGIVNAKKIRKERITDEQIEAAKATPVSSLVSFVRGKARAWCHDDRTPSLYHGTKKNFAVCPVCDKKFGPIDVLMTRDGLNFIEAVKQLAA